MKVVGSREWLAPGERRMRFSPLVDETRMMATPVVWPGTVVMKVVSMREVRREVMSEGPNSSAPTAPSMRTVMSDVALGEFDGFGRERRAQATAL